MDMQKITPRPETATCSTCCYWNQNDPDNKALGQCRRDPPIVIDDDMSNWPPTEATDWCGHHNSDWDNVEEGSTQARKNS